MRGEHRADKRIVEKSLQFGCGQSRLACMLEGQVNGAGPGRRARDIMSSGAANVVLVLGQIGKVGEIAEGTDHLHRLFGAQSG